MSDDVLKVEREAEASTLLDAYTTAEVAGNSRSASRREGLDAPSVQEPTVWDVLVRAFKEFLGIPFGLCTGAVALAVFVSGLDRQPPNWIEGFRGWLTSNIFGGVDGTIGALDMMAAGMFGLSTITFSMLLIALQQSAGATGIQIVDGFINRKRNQTVLGSLLAITIYVALTRVIGEDVNPALGAFLSLVLTLLSVFILAALFFMVTNQSRPNFMVDDLRAKVLHSRRRRHECLLKTRRESALPDMPYREVLTSERGYVSTVDFDTLRQAAATDPTGEIELVCEIGDYLVHGDPIARVRGIDGLDDATVRQAICQDSQRSLAHDPTAGLTSLYAMSWRTGSAAQQNQETTVNAINAVSDILVHWLHDEPMLSSGSEWNIVYPDTSLFQLIDGMEHQFVVANESLQPRPIVQLYSVVARTMDWMTPEVLDRMGDMVVRSLATLEKHYLTLNLERTLLMLASTFRDHGRENVATKIDSAIAKKRESLAV